MPYSGPATLADWLKRASVPTDRSGRSLVETLQLAQARITIKSNQSDSASSTAKDPDGLESLREWHAAATEPLHKLANLNVREFTLWIFRRLASALAHAHQRGIVHGDLKPANVLIRNDGQPALIDFNLSLSVDDGPRKWSGGTLAYMAPEQLDGLSSRRPGAALPQSDVYSLGLLIFEIVEGRLPFASPVSSAEADLIAATLDRKRAPIYQCARSVDEGVRRIIDRCLSFRPEDRYASGAELLEDLDLQAAFRPLRHARESWLGSRLPKLFRRYPRVFSAGSVGLLCCVFIAVLALSMLHYRRGAERLRAVQTMKLFDESSDQSFSQFLISDTWMGESAHDDRLKSISQSLEILGIRSTDESLDADSLDADSLQWEQLQELLTSEETRWIDERLLALAFVASHDHRKEERSNTQNDTAAFRQAVIQSIQERLTPESTQTLSAAATYAATSSSDPSIARPVPMVVASSGNSNRQSTNRADRTLLALGTLIQSRPDLAVELLEQTETPDSLSLIYWITKARAHLELNNSRQAVSAFTMALQNRETTAYVYLSRGLAQLRHSALNEAVDDFSESIRREPSLIAAYVNRHAALLALGKTEAALKDLNRAIQLSPESPRLRLIRARVFRQLGRLKDSNEDFSLAMKYRPVSSDDWVSVALARLPGDPARSLQDLQTAEVLFGGNSTVLQSMAHVLSEYLNRPEEAILALDRLLEKSPEFQKALAGRAVLLARAGKIDLVRSDLQRLSSLPVPPTPESLYQMACASALCSDKDPDLTPRAMLYLAEAVEKGYGGQLLLSDPDLELLRSKPEFDVIVKHFQLAAAYRK